ncbi:Hydra magnipapillata [Seminavis robusta]|uniref:Hydra magnipapillata n=1 Tax=Seminavis robusta TaxID=568900 RepID=A0A9N8H685_9STRA|nr:Hydra magnipapillata [Seminavis robusta]|eukprot:Sro138_g064720.1 Hydra magnipapillata (562) ;mRNA; r:42973-44658
MGCTSSKAAANGASPSSASPLKHPKTDLLETDNDHSDSPSSAAVLLSHKKKQADALLATEAYTEAFQQYEAILNLLLTKYDDTPHVSVADAYCDMAVCARVGGHPLLAWKYYKLASKMHTSVGGGEVSAPVAEIYDCLGSVLSDLDKPNEAITHHRMALQIHDKLRSTSTSNSSSSSTSDCKIHFHLGNCYCAVRMWDEALEHLQKAMDGFESGNTTNHTTSTTDYDMAECYLSLGMVHQKQRQYETAFSYHEMALLKAMSILDGPTDVLTFRSHMNMGICRYHHQQQYSSALDLLQKSLVAQIRIHGEYNIETATCLYHIAECHFAMQRQQQQKDAAMMYYQRAETALLQSVGEQHRLIYEVYTKLRKCYKSKGDTVKMIEYKEKAAHVKQVLRGDKSAKAANHHHKTTESSGGGGETTTTSTTEASSLSFNSTTGSSLLSFNNNNSTHGSGGILTGGNNNNNNNETTRRKMRELDMDTTHSTKQYFDARSGCLDTASGHNNKKKKKKNKKKGVSFGQGTELQISTVSFKMDAPSGDFDTDSSDDDDDEQEEVSPFGSAN